MRTNLSQMLPLHIIVIVKKYLKTKQAFSDSKGRRKMGEGEQILKNLHSTSAHGPVWAGDKVPDFPGFLGFQV